MNVKLGHQNPTNRSVALSIKFDDKKMKKKTTVNSDGKKNKEILVVIQVMGQP